MLIVRTEGRLFEHIIPIIKECELKGLKYIRDEDDGTVGKIGIMLLCCKRIYFDDQKENITYEDRTEIYKNL